MTVCECPKMRENYKVMEGNYVHLFEQDLIFCYSSDYEGGIVLLKDINEALES